MLTFALAACDGEQENKESSAGPQDSITENQPASPSREPAAEAPVPVPVPEEAEAPPAEPETTAETGDGTEAADQAAPVAGPTGDEPAAGGESIPPMESDDGEEAQTTLAEPAPGSELPPEAAPAPDPVPDAQPGTGAPAEPAAGSPPSRSAPAAKVPPTKPAAGPPAPETATAVPPRKPERASAAARRDEAAPPPARKPPADQATADAPIRQVAAMAPAERLPSDPSVVPTQARADAHPDLSQMLFKIQEVHFNPGSASLTPGGERKTLTASRFISDLRVRSIKVVGYTDTVGPTAFNQELALARAGSVARLLEHAGVPGGLIETVGMGETKVPMPTSDGISEPLNRCVGILVAVDDTP